MKKRLRSDPSAEQKLKAEIERHAAARYKVFAEGVVRYQQTRFKRDLPAQPVLWREGTTRLLDFGGKGKVALVIPSLINRYHVLDLSKQHSFMRSLKARGFHPLLIDWGEPGRAERDFTFEDYAARLQTVLQLAAKMNKSPVPVIGYCMGGLFAMALAHLAPKNIERLLFLATPWDFHAGEDAERQGARAAKLIPALENWGELPVDAMQAFFIMLAPFQVVEKFARFAGMDASSAAARQFVLLEDWVNDGVPLPKPLARECLQNWYAQNLPGRGLWKLNGKVVSPASCRIPSLHVIPSRDRIVPPESAAALASKMKGAVVVKPAFGHVSMMAHPLAAERLWPQLFDWLASRV